MKTRKMGKMILALLLAMLMVLPSLAAIAEDDPEPTELGDLKLIQVWAEEWDDEKRVYYWKKGTDGESDNGEAPSGVIIAGEVKTDGDNAVDNAVSVCGYGGTVDLTVGKVTAEKEQQAQGEMPSGVNILIFYEKSDVTFTSDDVVSDGDGLSVNNGVYKPGGKVTATTGKIEAGENGVGIKNFEGTVTVSTGNIAAGNEGVSVNNNNGTATVTTGGITAGSNGVEIYTRSDEQGNGLSGASEPNQQEAGNDEKSSEVVTSVSVNGDVVVTADGQAEDATGISLAVSGDDTTVSFVVDGKVSATSEDGNADGVNAIVSDGATVDGEVTGSVEANGETASAVNVQAQSGASVTIDIDDQVSATGEKYAMGVYAMTSDAESSVKVTVQDGGVVAEGDEDGEVFGVNTVNEDGEITVNVIGDTVSSGTGIYASDTETINSDTEEDTREGGTTKVTVVGDVQAEDTAVELELTEAKSTIEVTVDGTVEGKEHAIVLSEDTIAENLTMTVWEVKPNEDGNIVERVEYPEDGEGEAKYTADKETEKLIQYIVRIQDDSKPYIATTGTKDFTAGNGETYQVANEGDKVLVKLTIPEGKELVGAYWDKAQSAAGKLLTDSEGNYYVEVPRGGGVELSLVMKDIPKPEPEPEPEPQPEPVPETAKYSSAAPILTLKIQDGEVRIDFYRNGSFVVTLEDGSKEKGTYAFENDQLVLNCGSGKVQINADEPFTYTSSADASRTYQFKMSQADIETLKKK